VAQCCRSKIRMNRLPNTRQQTNASYRDGGLLRAGFQAVFALVLALGLAAARGNTTNFVDSFAPGFWDSEPSYGSILFTNLNTVLILEGPRAPATETVSLETITYQGPLAGGLTEAGTIEFHWSFTSVDATLAEAAIGWASGDDTGEYTFASGGPGFTDSGDFSLSLDTGAEISFLLTTTTPANKLSGTLVITDFRFIPVPEPSAGGLLAAFLALFGLTRFLPRRKAESLL
jgi:hypothetical protein